jgi:hypothetical protein
MRLGGWNYSKPLGKKNNSERMLGSFIYWIKKSICSTKFSASKRGLKIWHYSSIKKKYDSGLEFNFSDLVELAFDVVCYLSSDFRSFYCLVGPTIGILTDIQLRRDYWLLHNFMSIESASENSGLLLLIINIIIFAVSWKYS